MSFSIHRIEQPQATDNLLILANTADLLWVGKYLTTAEQAYLMHAAEQGINYIFFPKETQGILVHFIGLMDNAIDQKEANRRAGNEIITAITHYKIEAITILNKSGKKHLAEYVEGMVLGGYQFTKYLSGQDDTIRGAQTINLPATEISPLALEQLDIKPEIWSMNHSLI